MKAPNAPMRLAAAQSRRVCARGMLIGIAVLVLGCTSLEVHQMQDESSLSPGSFPYALAKTSLKPLFTVTLDKDSCPTKPAKNPVIKMSVSVVMTQASEADESERYYIDYGKLSSFLKTTNVKVFTNPDQTLQSVNSEINDQTLQVAGAVLQTAAQIGGALSIGPVPKLQTSPWSMKDLAEFIQKNRPSPTQESFQPCNEDTRKALAKLASDQNTLDRAVQASNKAGVAKVPVGAASGSTDAGVTYLTGQVAKDQQALTLTVPMILTPTMKDLQFDGNNKAGTAYYGIPLFNYVNLKWLDPKLRPDQVTRIEASLNGGQAVPLKADVTAVSIEIRVARWSTGCNVSGKDASTTCDPDAQFPRLTSPVKGLVLRQPALGFVRACVGKCMPLDNDQAPPLDNRGNPLDLMAPIKVSLPQLGRRLVLPLDNKLGTDATLGVTLATDGSGSIASLSYASTTNAAGGIAAIGTAASTYSSVMTANNTASTAINTATTAQMQANLNSATFADNVLKAQADCLQQVAGIIKAGGHPVMNCN